MARRRLEMGDSLVEQPISGTKTQIAIVGFHFPHYGHRLGLGHRARLRMSESQLQAIE